MTTIGILGLGSIGGRHASNLLAMGHKIIGHDPNIPTSPPKIYNNYFQQSTWHPDHRVELYNREELIEKAEAIVIATPTPDHFYDILSANPKPTLVEKPISDILSSFDLTGLPNLFVGYNLHFHPCVKQAKKWLPLIGQPQWASFVCAQFNNKPSYLRDGVILNWSHEIDLALYFLGSAKVSASATRLTNSNDDLTDILLTHTNGCRSNIHLDYITYPEKRGFDIIGSEGQIHVSLVTGTARLTCGKKNVAFYTENDWNKTYKAEMTSFLGDKQDLCTAVEGLKVLEICLEVRKQAGL